MYPLKITYAVYVIYSIFFGKTLACYNNSFNKEKYGIVEIDWEANENEKILK